MHSMHSATGDCATGSVVCDHTHTCHDTRRMLLQSQGQLTIDQQGIVWRKTGGGRKLELPKKGLHASLTEQRAYRT